MPPGGKRLDDAHDVVGGVLVGAVDLDRPDPAAPDWRQLSFAEAVLRECAAVVSYVADAEERRGHTQSAEHYRRLWQHAGDALPSLHRLAVGADTVPPSLLDDVRLGVDRLVRSMQTLERATLRETRDESDTAKPSAQCRNARMGRAS